MSDLLLSRVDHVQVDEINRPPRNYFAVQPTRVTLCAELAERVEERLKHELDEQSWPYETEDFADGARANAERRIANFQAR